MGKSIGTRKAVEFKPFMGLKDAAAYTGLSHYYLRTGCNDGTIPHIKSGKKIMVNVSRLLEELDAVPANKIKTISK